MTNLIRTLPIALVMIAVGCTQEAREKYSDANETAAKATEKTGEAIKTDAAQTGAAVKNAADNAGEAVKNTAENAAEAVDNSGVTLKVKNAILTASDLEAKDLNVDTIDKKVVLRGSVTSEENKKRAEQIAKGQVGKDYTVDNQLTVAQ